MDGCYQDEASLWRPPRNLSQLPESRSETAGNELIFQCGVASVPGRELNLIAAIDSLLSQRHFSCATIVVSIARVYRRFTKPFDREQVQRRFAREPAVKLLVASDDAGPISKLFGVLSVVEASRRQAWLVLIDDDHVYRPRMLQALAANVTEAARRPGSTRRVYTFYSYGLMRSHLRVAQGSDMIAVHSSALRCVRRFYLKLLAHERRFFLHDDVALAAFFFARGLTVHRLRVSDAAGPGYPTVYLQSNRSKQRLLGDGLFFLRGNVSRAALNRRLYDVLSLELPTRAWLRPSGRSRSAETARGGASLL